MTQVCPGHGLTHPDFQGIVQTGAFFHSIHDLSGISSENARSLHLFSDAQIIAWQAFQEIRSRLLSVNQVLSSYLSNPKLLEEP